MHSSSALIHARQQKNHISAANKQKNTLGAILAAAQDEFAALPPENQPNSMGKISGDCLEWLTEYIYENMTAFRLMISCSDGTRYADLIHKMVEIEVNVTHKFANNLEKPGYPKYTVEPQLEHMLCSGLLSAYFELVAHDIPYEKVKEYVRGLRAFYTAGRQKIMGL